MTVLNQQAGMLGGVTRMTISLTVILLEVSSDIQLLMPIMIAILCAKVRAVHVLYKCSAHAVHMHMCMHMCMCM